MKNRLLFYIFIACFSAGASGYSQRTHEAISAVAFRASILGVLSQNSQLSDIGLIEQQINGYTANGQNPNWDIQKWVTQGAYDEDLNIRPLHHFFNPINQRGLLGLESALEWGLELSADISDQDYSYKGGQRFSAHLLSLSLVGKKSCPHRAIYDNGIYSDLIFIKCINNTMFLVDSPGPITL